MLTHYARRAVHTRRRVTRAVSALLHVVFAASALYLGATVCAYVFEAATVRRHHVESAVYIFAASGLALGAVRGRRAALARPASAPEPERRAWAVAGMFIPGALLLYGNTLFLGLFSDDFVLRRHALAGEWLPQEEFVRPLPLLAWSALLRTARDPAALHLLNVLLHGLNASLVWRLARTLGLPPVSALVAGLLFLVYPASVEAVAWPAAVHDVVVATSALGFLLLAASHGTVMRVTAAVLLLAMGLLTKESAVVIPLLAIVLWARPGALRLTPGWPAIAAGLAVCAIYAGVRFAFVAIPATYLQGTGRYLLKELIARPVGTLTLPWSAAVFTSWPAIPFLWAVACIAAAFAWNWRASASVPASTVGRCLGAVFVAVVPVYSMLFVTRDLENARYLYLSTAFWAIAMMAFASSADGLVRGPLLVALTAIVVGAAGVQIHLSAWRDAANLRDRVLTAAARGLEDSTCGTVSLAGAPDSIHGAYVFRNGLPEALALRTGAVPADAPASCLLLWDGTAFRRAASAPGLVQATVTR